MTRIKPDRTDSGIDSASDTLRIDALNPAHKDTEILRSSARLVLHNLKAENHDTVSLAQVRDKKNIIAAGNNNGDGTYLIIAGERRYRASKIAGLETIPAVVKNYTPKQIKEISIIENLQREDLNPIEAARAIKQLMEEYKWTQEVVAERIGKSRPVIANYLRLLSLTPEVLSMIEDGSLSAGHARCLVVITDPRDQYKMALSAKNNRISVRELEKAVKNLLNPKSKGGNLTVEQSPELKELINEMQRVFATKVSAIGNDRKGRIYIDYYSRDDLDRICQLLELVNKKTLTLKDLNNFNKTSKK